MKEIVAQKPDAPAITSQDTTRTWKDLHLRTNRIARGMLSKGVKFGDFVTIALPNGNGFIEACYAAWKIGATPQPVSSRLPAGELAAIIELANSPIVVSDMPMPSPRPVVSIAELHGASPDDSDLPEAIAPAYKAPTSGGSTGRPKLIVSGSRGVTVKGGMEGSFWRYDGNSTVLMPGPLYHNGPFGCVFGALNAGAHVVVMPKFDVEDTLRHIEKYKADWIYLVPTMMSRIWRAAEPRTVRRVVAEDAVASRGALPAAPERGVHSLAGRRHHHGAVCRDRGAMRDDDHRHRVAEPSRLGRARDGRCGRRWRRSAPTAAGIAGGRGGRNLHAARSVAAAVLSPASARETRTLAGGWESIGDIGWFDADGYLYLADRRTDMILVGGANVYPAEIEAALEEHPLVASSAVIGLPNDDLGNTVHAIIQPRPGLDLDDLQKHLAERLVVYKRPRTFELVEENVRDDAGKVRRNGARRRCAGEGSPS